VTLKHFGASIDTFARPYAALSRRVLQIGNLTEEEARLLEKPERRFYSVEGAKVRSSIMDEIVRTVSPDEIAQYCTQYIKPAYR